MDEKAENRKVLEKIAVEMGASLFGVALLDGARKYFHPSLEGSSAGLEYGISVGVRLSDSVLEGIDGSPTLIYKHHYSAVNRLLDQVALRISGEIQKKGAKALAIPASQIVDWEKQLGHLSHRVIAYYAGLGWIGKPTLLVNPQFGARVRYATVLTDLVLEPDKPVEGSCGECVECVKACPAGAVSKEGYDKEKCLGKLREFAKEQGIGQFICGVCVKACRGCH
jgi:epoxyqueuosine reductase